MCGWWARRCPRISRGRRRRLIGVPARLRRPGVDHDANCVRLARIAAPACRGRAWCSSSAGRRSASGCTPTRVGDALRLAHRRQRAVGARLVVVARGARRAHGADDRPLHGGGSRRFRAGRATEPLIRGTAAARGRRRWRAGTRKHAARRPPNVILLVLESVALRWTSFGGRYDTTPTLKAEAAHAHRLRQCLRAHRPQLELAGVDSAVDLPEAELPRLHRRVSAGRTHVDRRAVPRSRLSDRLHDLERSRLGRMGRVSAVARLRRRQGRPRARRARPPVSSWGVEDRCLVDGLIDYISARSRRGRFLRWDGRSRRIIPTSRRPACRSSIWSQNREPVPDEYDLQRYLNVLHETDRQLGAAVRRGPRRRPRRRHDDRRRRRSWTGVRLSARQLSAGADRLRGRRARADARLVAAALSQRKRTRRRSAATSTWR